VSEPVRDVIVDEIKEFMEEQRKRLASYGGDDDDDDDYFDNDAEMDYGDDPNDDDEDLGSDPSSPSKKDWTPNQTQVLFFLLFKILKPWRDSNPRY
jgi:hypothetical protein